MGNALCSWTLCMNNMFCSHFTTEYCKVKGSQQHLAAAQEILHWTTELRAMRIIIFNILRFPHWINLLKLNIVNGTTALKKCFLIFAKKTNKQQNTLIRDYKLHFFIIKIHVFILLCWKKKQFMLYFFSHNDQQKLFAPDPHSPNRYQYTDW